MTIQDVIDLIIDAVPGAPKDGSVDTVKSGDPSQAVTGIVSTFLATSAVIEQAIERGANMIITHEPTFYNHLDIRNWRFNPPFSIPGSASACGRRRLLARRGGWRGVRRLSPASR